MYGKSFITAVIFFFCFVNVLPAQEGNGELFTRCVLWTYDAYAFRYEVLIEQEHDGVFGIILQAFTYDSYLPVSLPLGNFRLRIIPYDFRDLPVEGSPWKYFSVAAREEEPQLVVEDLPAPIIEEIAAPYEQEEIIVLNLRRFNTVGVSAVALGSNNFIPFGAAVRGTFSPFNNFFAEVGVESSFWGINVYLEGEHSYRENFSIQPFAGVGIFLPFTEIIDWYASAGIGFSYVEYEFLYESGNETSFVVNITTGLNFWGWLDVSYTLRTDLNRPNNLFTNLQSRLAIGYVFRFRPRITAVPRPPKPSPARNPI